MLYVGEALARGGGSLSVTEQVRSSKPTRPDLKVHSLLHVVVRCESLRSWHPTDIHVMWFAKSLYRLS